MSAFEQLQQRSLQGFRRLGYFLVPPTCCVCSNPGQPQLDLCASCQQHLSWTEHACQQCGISLASNQAQCGHCLQAAPKFDSCLSLFEYRPPIIELINGLKFHDQFAYAHTLGRLMAERLSNVPMAKLPEAIIPMPLHRRRLRQRGYNQALELARPVARQLNLPLLTRGVKRKRQTEQQTQLSAAKRASNMRGAFTVEQSLPQHVAILDDVMTTGSTANALSATLKQAGVERVDVWCVARATLAN